MYFMYATAAAGCGLIAEDFRLKRAVEAFKPMSEVNKVFGRFYQMCEALFTTENTAAQLADCIALADALAVTQGSFQDVSECEVREYELCLKPQTISRQCLEEVKNSLVSGDYNKSAFLQEDMEKALDPRLFPFFIQNLYKGTVVLESMAAVLLPQLGDSVIPLLKEQVDLITVGPKNRTAYYVRLVSKFYGEKANDWYLSLIEGEKNPPSIRAAAIRALACSQENASKVLELYHTQKGVAKNAAALTLAELDPPEAEEIWIKCTKKYKSSYDEFIMHSKNDICAEFAKNEFQNALKGCREICEGKVNLTHKDRIDHNDNLERAIKLIRRKPQLENCFFEFAQNYKYVKKVANGPYNNWQEEMNKVLLENLLVDDQRYAEMIKKVYEAYPEFYFPARFFLELKEKGEDAFKEFHKEMYHNRKRMLSLLDCTRYDNIRDGYYLSWDFLGCLYGENQMERNEIKIFEQLPEIVLTFVTDTGYFVPGQGENEIKMEKAERKVHVEWAVQVLRSWCQDLKPGTEEYKKCVDAAIKFAFQVNQHCSIGKEIQDIIIPFYTEGTSKEYRGLIRNHIAQSEIRKEGFLWKINMLDKLPMSYEDKKEELIEIDGMIDGLKDVDSTAKKRIRSQVQELLKTTYA